jgi:hypothetical protein
MTENTDGTSTQNSAFERHRRPFKMLGKEFYFQFIPSIHFQEALRQVLEILMTMDFVGNDTVFKNPNGTPHASTTNTDAQTIPPLGEYAPILGKLRTILEEKIYQILFDVLLYQNDERIEMETLKYKTSPLEIAEFLHLILSDDEIIRAVGVITSGLGKLIEKLTQIPSATPNSTLSS